MDSNIEKSLSIALIDDHQMVREGFSDLLELNKNWVVRASCADYQSAINILKNTNVDIAIIDISLPDKSGLELAIWLRNNAPQTRTIIVSMHEHSHYIKRALDIGVVGYVSKKGAATELIDAIIAVKNEEFYISPELRKKIETEQITGEVDYIKLLTPREMEIFKLTALGNNPKQIAKILDIDHKTVFTHRAKIYEKLKLKSPFEALKYGIKTGAIPLEVLAE